eukprot:Nk52_evm1s376 gene=Nk52_evmTU1s376
MSSDREKQLEEIEALVAIYGEESVRAGEVSSEGGEKYHLEIQITLTRGKDEEECVGRPDQGLNQEEEEDGGGGRGVRVCAVLGEGYPSREGPVFRVEGAGGREREIQGLLEECARVVGGWEEEEEEEEGRVVLFDCVEAVRGVLQEVWEREEEEERKRRREEEEEKKKKKREEEEEKERKRISQAKADTNPRGNGHVEEISSIVTAVVHGEPIVDRKSVFQAHCAVVHSREEALRVVDALIQSSKRIASATHNIMAYRCCTTHPTLPSPPSSSSSSSSSFSSSRCVISSDCDDDGEAAAGSRLLHLLDLLHAHNVVVIVSRDYGGTKLGPARFKHINNAARDVLVRHNLLPNV